MSESVLPTYSSRNFTAFGLTFRYLINFELIVSLYLIQDGGVGCVFIFSCEDSKIAINCWTAISMIMSWWVIFWVPPKKGTPHPRAKEKLQQDSRREKIEFRIKHHTHQWCLEGSNKTLCTPGPESMDPTIDWARHALSIWISSVEARVSSGLPWGQGLLLQQIWEARCVSPTTKPLNRNLTIWRIVRLQLHQRSFHRVAKVLEPTVDFLIWGSSKGTENPRESDYEGQWDLIIKLPQNWGKRLLEGTNKTLCTVGPRRKEQWPHRRLSQTCQWVSRSLWQRGGLKVACHGVSGTDYSSLA